MAMRDSTDDEIHQEIELLTGTLFEGDATSILFNLFSSNSYKGILISDIDDNNENPGGSAVNVQSEEPIEVARTERIERPNFGDWFSSGHKVNPIL